MKMNVCTLSAFIVASALTSAAQALPIANTEITASTNDIAMCGAICGGINRPISQVVDGITGDAWPFNGYAGENGDLGTVHLAFLNAYDIDSFSLWNDMNIVNEGVRTFRLNFFDEAQQLIGSSDVLSAISQFAAQTYTFADAFLNVRSVDMEILSVSRGVEIRELAFNGTLSGTQPSTNVPEPGTLGLLAAGITGLGLARRRSKH